MTPLSNNSLPRNGHSHGTEPLNATAASAPALFPATYTPSWAEPEPDETADERRRLEAEIISAKHRAAVARERAAARESDVQAALREELVSSRESLTEIERKYDEAIRLVREAAQLEVERILAAARQQAALRTLGGGHVG